MKHGFKKGDKVYFISEWDEDDQISSGQIVKILEYHVAGDCIIQIDDSEDSVYACFKENCVAKSKEETIKKYKKEEGEHLDREIKKLIKRKLEIAKL